jgi:hypothetical protein
MISFKYYNNKWQIHIGDEIWEFDTIDKFKITLWQLIDMKDKYGKRSGFLP